MAVVKLNEAKTIVMFISDDLGIYYLPISVMLKVIQEPEKWKMVTLTRMSKDASPGQFKPSPRWGDKTVASNHEGTGLNLTKDKQVAAKPIEDKVVW